MAEMTSDDIAVAAPAATGADSSPAPPPPPDSTPAPATAAPDGGLPPAESAGPIPLDRHKAILEHAREEAKRQAETEFRKQYGWAERYQPNEVEQAQRLLAWYKQDPQQFLAYLQQQHPPEKKDEPPAPDLRAEDGTPVYSAPQLQKLLEYQRAQFAQQVQQEYGPVRQAMQAQQMQQAAYVQAQQTLTTARTTWPRFPDLEPDIKEAMRANPALDLRDAYIQVFAEKGRALERESWKAEYEGTVQTKTAATTPRPGRAAHVQPRNYTEMDPRDVVEDVAKQIGWRG